MFSLLKVETGEDNVSRPSLSGSPHLTSSPVSPSLSPSRQWVKSCKVERKSPDNWTLIHSVKPSAPWKYQKIYHFAVNIWNYETFMSNYWLVEVACHRYNNILGRNIRVLWLTMSPSIIMLSTLSSHWSLVPSLLTQDCVLIGPWRPPVSLSLV